MKIFIAIVLAVISAALFLPHRGTEIRNVPLLLAILFLIGTVFIIRVIRYIILGMKTKTILSKKGFRCVKFVMFPFGSMLHGRYNMIFQSEKEELNLVLLVRKKTYQHYYFQDINHIEFYRSNRVVFTNTKVRGATISKAVETKLVGKQKIKWVQGDAHLNSINIVLFDQLPFKVTDTVRREELGNSDPICSSNIRLYDLKGLQDLNQIAK